MGENKFYRERPNLNGLLIGLIIGIIGASLVVHNIIKNYQHEIRVNNKLIKVLWDLRENHGKRCPDKNAIYFSNIWSNK